MIYVKIPEETHEKVSFYLSMEEFVARNLAQQDYFMMWQVSPSVIFGRNQLIENEVNIQFCKQRGIKMFRRKSGGGCVYADMNNIMCAFVTKADNVAFAYNRYVTLMLLALRTLGVEAKANMRNDILIGDRKVAGNAFYRIGDTNIIHGTLLYDTDMENMMGAITPTKEKLLTKGIESVRQRVALLKDFVSVDIEEVKTIIRKTLCQEELLLAKEDIETIRHIEKEYLSERFIYGNNPKFTIIRKQRIQDVGEMEARIVMKNNAIVSIQLTGDFFPIDDVTKITNPLKGVVLEPKQIENALPDNTEQIILNLNKQQLISFLIPN